MSNFKKVINLLYCLVLVCIVVVLYSMAFNLEFMESFIVSLRSDSNYTMVLNMFVILVLLVTGLRVIYLLFKKSDDSYLLLFEDEGSIMISDRSIERTVRQAASKIQEIGQLDVKTSIKNKKDGESDIKVYIKCGLDYEKCMQDYSSIDNDQAIGMTELTNMIQEELHKAVENFIGQRVNEINIKFYDIEKKDKFDKSYKKSQQESEYGDKVKRVK
nr:alkaline shock response membrane anchor protein AmaP [uncultured Peptostreptococcus sp.]